MRGEGPIPRSRRLVFATLFALAVGHAAYAQQIGSTAEAHNSVSRELAGAAAALTAGDFGFSRRDRPHGAESTAKLVFLDSTNLAIGPTSRVTLDVFVYSGQASAQKMTVNLAKGMFRFTTGALDKRAYVISTPTASIGVRGTVLDIGVQGPQQMRVTLVEGQALVCPRRPGITFEQQVGNCSQGGGGRCECLDLNHAGQTAQVKKSGGANQGDLRLDPGRFRVALLGRLVALLRRKLCLADARRRRRRRRLPIGGAMRTLGPRTSTGARWSFALAVAAGFAGAAWAEPSNQPPPSGAILDLNGGLIPHGAPQTYTVVFTSALTNTAITFAFREDPAFVSVFNTSVVNLTTSSGNLLRNGDFSGGTYTDHGNSATPTSWTYANIYGASAGGVVTSSCGGYGSHCWYDGAVQAYDAISQTISTTVGDTYQVSFSATDNSGLTDWSRVSTNGDVTGTGGNGADILVYAQAGLPPAACAGAPEVNIKASGGQTCFASGSYVSTDVIAGQATGAGAVLTNVNEGQSSVSFSTSAANTPAVQADTGGSVTLTVTQPSTSGTVTTTGDNSIGLYATGSASTDSGPVASSINAQNVNVTTQGSNASGVQADNGGLVTLNGGSVATSGAGALGIYALGSGSKINVTGVSLTTAGVGAAGVRTDNGATTNMGGASVATTGQDAHALFVTGSGSAANLSGAGTFATQGAGAIGLYATLGGGVSATGSATITTSGGVSSATGFGANGVVADGAGSQGQSWRGDDHDVRRRAPSGFSPATSTASGSAGSISVDRRAQHQHDQRRRRAAVGLQGNGASILATGGGTITSAGDAIEFPAVPRTRSRPSTISPSTICPAISSSPIRRRRRSISTARPPTPEATIF